MRAELKALEDIRAFLQHWPVLWGCIAVISLAIIYYLTLQLANKTILRFFRKLVKKSKILWDDYLIDHGALTVMVGLVPLMVIYGAAGWFDGVTEGLRVFIKGVIVFQVTLAIDRTMSASLDYYQSLDISQRIPIKSYVQLSKLLVWILGVLIAVSTWMGQSPWVLVSGVGAITAVLMLVFKDTLLSLIAGIQIATNNLVRVGDWIEVPDFDANGDVIEIGLHQVIVSNFDKTISAVPVYKLIEGGFRNWRGMSETGARRIKRSILIDQHSIAPIKKDVILSLKEHNLLFNRECQPLEIDQALQQHEATNLELFRNWLESMMHDHEDIADHLTLIVRELAPTPYGLPVEFYGFAKTTNWVRFERIQADLLDHILSKLSFFELQVFQAQALPPQPN